MQDLIDAVAYEGLPITQSHISHIYMIARLFRVDAPDFRRARVLEVGCGDGGNILPMAVQYPDSTFVGFDTSQSRIDQAQSLAGDIALTNVTFKVGTVNELDSVPGSFDYIICPGQLSWLDFVDQLALLKRITELLSPNGIVYLSYNTLPGWSQVRSLRDMIRYHCAQFTNLSEKINQAKVLLEFVRDAQPQNSAYRTLVETEIAVIGSLPVSGLLHDYFGDNNCQHYFHEVATMAAANRLQYVADASLSSMFLGNFDEAVVTALQGLSNDVIKLEQYMDFITNRRVRHTLLCHAALNIHRALEPSQLEPFYLRSLLLPADPNQAPSPGMEFRSSLGVTFTSPDITTSRTFLTLQTLNSKPHRVDDIVSSVAKLYPDEAEGAIRASIDANAVRLILAGAMTVHADPGNTVATAGPRPCALPLARLQAQRGARVTNGYHESITLTPVWQRILPFLDGQHTVPEIEVLILEGVSGGEFSICNSNGEPLSAPDAAVVVSETVRLALAELSWNAMLTA